jgi:pimeloyl-ACP methyl ester carboxylesterase
VREERVRVWQGEVETQVTVGGSGPPLLYLHGPWGLGADGDFLERLAATHTVYAPCHPGTGRGDPDAIYHFQTWLDLVVYYGELLDRLGLRAPALVGHSFGGMVACELAAAAPERASKLVLLAPLGLWREDLPVKNWMIVPEEERRAALFAAPQGEPAERFFRLPEERAARVEAQARVTWSQGCTAKFFWPIPDRGLRKHLHRIAAPTLLIWGHQDGVAPAGYAQEFARRLAHARVELLDGAGHLPHLEQPEAVARLVRGFLGN